MKQKDFTYPISSLGFFSIAFSFKLIGLALGIRSLKNKLFTKNACACVKENAGSLEKN